MPIEIKNLTYIYNEDTVFEKKALDNISFVIQDGEFIGLIGQTGSGKSTLIQHLNALISPTSGEVIIDGEHIHRDKSRLKAIRQKVGLVFQYPEHQLFETTVYKDIAFGPANMGLSPEEIDIRVRESAETAGLFTEDFEKSPFELSGGQKRRVAIAGILAMRPKVLVLDEPTAGLDPKGRNDILLAIKNMHKELNITVILVSHSMEDVARLANRIIVIDKGQIALSGTPKEVFSHTERLSKIGLASPQITYVFKELALKGMDVRKDIFTTEEAVFEIKRLLGQVAE